MSQHSNISLVDMLSRVPVATNVLQTSRFNAEVTDSGTLITCKEPFFTAQTSNFQVVWQPITRTCETTFLQLVPPPGMFPYPSLSLYFIHLWFTKIPIIIVFHLHRYLPPISWPFNRLMAFLASHSVLKRTNRNPLDAPIVLFSCTNTSNGKPASWKCPKSSVVVSFGGKLVTNRYQQSWILLKLPSSTSYLSCPDQISNISTGTISS